MISDCRASFPLEVSGRVFRLFVVLLDPHVLNPPVQLDPSPLQILIETRLLARKPSALEAEIYALLLVASTDTAPFEQLAVFVPASLAMLGREVLQHRAELCVLRKDRSVEERLESLGEGAEVTQLLSEFQTVSSDVAFRVGKALLATQPAGAQRIEYRLVRHPRLLGNPINQLSIPIPRRRPRRSPMTQAGFAVEPQGSRGHRAV